MKRFKSKGEGGTSTTTRSPGKNHEGKRHTVETQITSILGRIAPSYVTKMSKFQEEEDKVEKQCARLQRRKQRRKENKKDMQNNDEDMKSNNECTEERKSKKKKKNIQSKKSNME